MTLAVVRQLAAFRLVPGDVIVDPDDSRQWQVVSRMYGPLDQGHTVGFLVRPWPVPRGRVQPRSKVYDHDQRLPLLGLPPGAQRRPQPTEG